MEFPLDRRSKHTRESSKSTLSEVLISALGTEKCTTSYARHVSDGFLDERIGKAIDQEIYEDDDEKMTSFIESHDNEDLRLKSWVVIPKPSTQIEQKKDSLKIVKKKDYRKSLLWQRIHRSKQSSETCWQIRDTMWHPESGAVKWKKCFVFFTPIKLENHMINCERNCTKHEAINWEKTPKYMLSEKYCFISESQCISSKIK